MSEMINRRKKDIEQERKYLEELKEHMNKIYCECIINI